MNVAQLKRDALYPGRERPGLRFHVRMNVAQLKRAGSLRDGLPAAEFPRSNERGSIEAGARESRPARARPRFHVRMNVAQLKLDRGVGDAQFAGGFHVRMNVAQLKQM